MAYVYQPYPRMLYRGQGQCVVQDYAEEQAAIADGWGHVPGFVATVPDPKPPPPTDVDVVLPPPSDSALRRPHRKKIDL
jgi:hypothetical protein